MRHHWGWTVVVLILAFIAGGYFGGIAGVRAKLGV